MSEIVKLTRLSHGGGCGCKIAPAVLERLLSDLPKSALAFPDLLVGIENGDDAAVYRIGNGMALVATTDFFMPIVDDPVDFGRIAATNALSDIYAMGAKPILALALLAMPLDKLPDHVIRDIVRGGHMACEAAGIPLAGGHSIDSVEPIYGLVALGLVEEAKIKRNDSAKAGDILILGKPLGIGILSAALKKGELSARGYQAMIDLTTRLNSVGMSLGELDGVHAMTDVTGFGLLGHCFEICRGSGLSARIDFAAVPLISETRQHAINGIVTGASGRNWSSYGAEIALEPGILDWQKNLLTDPQTSGGLLVACAQDSVSDILSRFHAEGFADAAVIGKLEAGKAGISVSM
ncbi:MAG: selenide, water dikinase SelD [Alphaproteobacteria bacterium]|nr:selenide, water dikinase SelD [Alphaproteobacteria bacterium]